MLKYFFFLLISGIIIPFYSVSQVKVEGIVYVDKNKDGKYQQGEKLLKDVLISSGDTIVKTTRKGTYQLMVANGSSVFPVLPGNIGFNTQGISSRTFKFIDFASKESVIRHDFALIPVDNPTEFRVDVIGDVQVNDMDELHYAQQTVFSELMQNGDKDFTLFMGDLSNDNDSMLLKVRDCIASLPSISWSIVGNHDLTEAKPRSSEMFSQLLGTDVFAFFRGKACFIGLNNSKGYVPQPQIRFIRQLMQLLPKDILPVICQHIPLYSVSNRDEVLEAIGSRSCLVLSAHAHNISRHIWNKNINEWVVGAACGSWWVGEKDYRGTPSALQQCGAPRNYFQLFMNGTDYHLKFKGIDLDPSHQMNIWIKGQDVLDDSIAALSRLPEGLVVANIYAGSDSTKVEYSLNGSDWMLMSHTDMADPTVTRIIEWNSRKYYPTKYSKKIPLRKHNSPHIWTCKLPKLEEGSHIIKIRASDNYGLLPIEQSRIFYISKKVNK